MKRYSEFLHVPTGSYRQIIGARLAEAGKAFATITKENARERLFLLDTFDQAHKVEIAALWETLWAKESARMKAKARKDQCLENMRHARSQAEWQDDDENRDDLKGATEEPEFETLAPEDSCGEPFEEEPEEEIEVLEE